MDIENVVRKMIIEFMKMGNAHHMSEFKGDFSKWHMAAMAIEMERLNTFAAQEKKNEVTCRPTSDR